MTKSKLKKSYCIMSFVFAVAVLIIALTLSMGQTRVYAADTSSDMITGLSNTDSSDGLTDATSDINNGLSIHTTTTPEPYPRRSRHFWC